MQRPFSSWNLSSQSQSARPPVGRQREEDKQHRHAERNRNQPAHPIACPRAHSVIDPRQRQQRKHCCHAFMKKLSQRSPHSPESSHTLPGSLSCCRRHAEILTQNLVLAESARSPRTSHLSNRAVDVLETVAVTSLVSDKTCA